MIGKMLSHFRVDAQIGAGGMGEVYRAHDTKLGRDVALKLLPVAFSSDPERVARFQREARTLASLQHPHVATLFGIEEADGHTFLEMELVEGEDLSARITRGALPVETALELARQIAEGLEAAHENGIVHRDLKPANIKLTPEGEVKILDFGLARAYMGDPTSNADLDHSPTITAAMTQAGVILGTAAYMSPEQAKGKTVDKRTDIWAFGAVLFEMLTGRQAFPGETVSETLASVLKTDPEWAALPSNTPPAVRRLLERCLDRDPRRRLRDIGDARVIVEDALAGRDRQQDAATPAGAHAGHRLLWTAAVVIAAVAAAAATWFLRPGPPPEPLVHVEVAVGGKSPIFASAGCGAVLSPDGRTLAYVTGNSSDVSTFRLNIRHLDRLDGQVLAGTEQAYNPFFSPDGQWIGFVTPNELKKISVAGGTPLTLCSVSLCRGATWGENGTIVFAPSPAAGLAEVPATGGTPKPLTTLGEGEASDRWPQFLPGSHQVLFTSYASTDRNAGRIEVVDVDTGKRTLVHQGGTYARYAAGHLLFVNNNTLFAAPFDLGALKLKSLPAPVLEDVAMNTDGGAMYDVSADGTLVYLTGRVATATYRLLWLDLAGHPTPVNDTMKQYGVARLSPDNKRLAVEITSDGNTDIWVYDLERNTQTRLTFGDGPEVSPVWSPDGKAIYYTAASNQMPGIFRKSADGSGEETLVADSLGTFTVTPYSISPDGKFLAYHDQSPTANVHILPLDGKSRPYTFFTTQSIDGDPVFSPDGRWISYDSNESGRWEVYVRPFPGRGGKWQVSTEGGEFARWSADGTHLFYKNRAGGAWRVAVKAHGDSFDAGQPEKLFDLPRAISSDWDVTADGKRFLVVQQGGTAEGAGPNLVKLAFHWDQELQRLLATPR